MEGILHIADMYDTPMVVRKCEEFLIKGTKLPAKKKLQMAFRYKMENFMVLFFGNIQRKVFNFFRETTTLN